MATSLHPYLNFNGNTEAAMRFYADVLRAELNVMRFSDAPMPCTPETKDLVMHATLKTNDGLVLMASDGRPGQPVVQGDSVHLSLNFTDKAEQQRVWDGLAQGATITMPLGDQFFGRFGILTDRFGMHWMLHFNTAH